MTFYRAVELPSDEPVQYVGVYVLRWGKVDQPTMGFVEDETVSDLLAALEKIKEILTVPDFGEDEQAYVVFALEAVDLAREQARAALAGAQGGGG